MLQTRYIIMSYIVNRLTKTSQLFVVIFMSLSGRSISNTPIVCKCILGVSILPIPDHLFTPPNQGTVLGLQAINPGLNIPNNLVMAPSCSFSCPPVIGTLPGSIVVATGTVDASIFGLGGNNILQCGEGACKAVAGPGNNVLLATSLVRLLIITDYMEVLEIISS